MMWCKWSCSAQKEVKSWIDAFQAKHGRKPTVQDALACGDSWVAEKYKHYQLQKDRLTSEIPSMRDALAGQTKGVSARNSRGRRCDRGSNGNIAPVSAAEATARVQAAMTYRRQRQPQQVAARTSTESDSDASQVSDASSDAAARILGLQSKVQGSTSGANPRAKAALLKAMQYKKGRTASAQAKVDAEGGPNVSVGSMSAVQLVSVEGKAIGGVDYSAIDASSAAAGESQLIQAGHMPVTSYRDATILCDAGSPGTGIPNTVSVAHVPNAAMADGDSSSSSRSCSEPPNLEHLNQKTSPAHLSGEGILCAATSCDTSYVESNKQGKVLQHLKCGESMDSGSRGVEWDEPNLNLSGAVGVATCSDLAPAVAGADRTTATALIELRGKQAVATAAVEAAATAAALAAARNELGSICMHDSSEGGLVTAACAAAMRAEQLQLEFDEARSAVMQLMRDGADTYRGGLMLLRRLL